MLEGLRPRGVPEEAVPFPEVLGYWGFRVENGEVESLPGRGSLVLCGSW